MVQCCIKGLYCFCFRFYLDVTINLSNEIEFVVWFWTLIKYNDKIMYEIDIR